MQARKTIEQRNLNLSLSHHFPTSQCPEHRDNPKTEQKKIRISRGTERVNKAD